MTKLYFLNPQNKDKLQWKTTSKKSRWNISATSVLIMTYEFLEENLEEISSVALLSPACFSFFLLRLPSFFLFNHSSKYKANLEHKLLDFNLQVFSPL